MLSKQQIKLINGIKKKKLRTNNKLFIAEGIKVVEEFLQSEFKPLKIYCTNNYLNPFSISHLEFVSEKELKSISNFSNPNQILGIFEIPSERKITTKGLTLVLDDINDPGNLGTIIRLCDWFGVNQIICSKNTVDCYNPKVVQASMGSLSRISLIYTDLIPFLKKEKRTIYGALLNGKSVYQSKLDETGILIMGNEANGISIEVLNLVSNKVSIPQFGENKKTESLNVATATAILLSEFKR